MMAITCSGVIPKYGDAADAEHDGDYMFGRYLQYGAAADAEHDGDYMSGRYLQYGDAADAEHDGDYMSGRYPTTSPQSSASYRSSPAAESTLWSRRGRGASPVLRSPYPVLFSYNAAK
ncbi:MAG: hypothetical protein LBB63_01095 [Holosporaceae bacterium]|nr:hypothetical protein [Holosporaceae bacterium]